MPRMENQNTRRKMRILLGNNELLSSRLFYTSIIIFVIVHHSQFVNTVLPSSGSVLP